MSLKRSRLNGFFAVGASDGDEQTLRATTAFNAFGIVYGAFRRETVGLMNRVLSGSDEIFVEGGSKERTLSAQLTVTFSLPLLGGY